MIITVSNRSPKGADYDLRLTAPHACSLTLLDCLILFVVHAWLPGSLCMVHILLYIGSKFSKVTTVLWLPHAGYKALAMLE